MTSQLRPKTADLVAARAGGLTGKTNPLAFLQGFNRIGSAKNNTNSPANHSGGTNAAAGPKRGKINLLTQGMEVMPGGKEEGPVQDKSNYAIPSIQLGPSARGAAGGSGAGYNSYNAAEDAYDNLRPGRKAPVAQHNAQDERMKYLLKFGKVLWAGPDYNSVFVELPQIPGVSIYYRKDVLRLNFSNHEMTHVPRLEGEENLAELVLSNNSIQKIDNLISLDALISLNLSHNLIGRSSSNRTTSLFFSLGSVGYR